MPQPWRHEAIEAARLWFNLEKGDTQEGWQCLGEAMNGPEPDWLVFDQRPNKIPSFSESCFSNEDGPDHSVWYPVNSAREVDDVLYVKKPPGLPDNVRRLWVQKVSLRRLVQKLVDGLEHARHTELAETLALRRLSPSQNPHISAPTRLTEDQKQAYRLCFTPGVGLVWGPPGAGKTRVLSEAISTLLQDGKRVLLVSTANVAVDNALKAVVERGQLAPGVVVRVGNPQLPEIANNPGIQLKPMAAQASADVERELQAIEAQLTEHDNLNSAIEKLEANLMGFDATAFDNAQARLQNEQTLVELRHSLDRVDAELTAAARNDEEARSRAANAEAEWEGIKVEREALEQATQRHEELAQLQFERNEDEIEVANATRRAETTQGLLKKPRAKRQLRNLVRQVQLREQRRVEDERRIRESIDGWTQRAGDVTPEVVSARQVACDQALATANETTRTRNELHHQAEQLRQQCWEVEANGLPTQADRDLVERAKTEHLPAQQDELQQLLDQQRANHSVRMTLKTRAQTLMKRASRLRQDAERQILSEAKLVATTLAQSRLHPGLAEAEFDIVLVDEVGAAKLVEVLLVLCRTKTTAVLFGDFLQLPPVVDKKLGEAGPKVDKWVLPSPFSHLGIETAQDAERNPNCICLHHQFRFGAGLQQLANDVIYDVLRHGSEVGGPSNHTAITVIDTERLGGPEQISRPEGGVRGWSVAGVAITQALAQRYALRGFEVGVVTPYNLQAEATLLGLRDQGIVEGVTVGSAHAMQGREFPVVIFDLVEDGLGWMANAERGSSNNYQTDGVKLFGVGITRAKDHLFVIVNGHALRRRGNGPLAALKRAIDDGRAEVWSAADLLGLEAVPPAKPSQTYDEIRSWLSQQVTITEITDEKTFYAIFERHLAAATASVWMWAPWTANRTHSVLPWLMDALQRGVKVTVFVRDETDQAMKEPRYQEALLALKQSGATVIHSEDEHRKLIIIDRTTVLCGSLNPLSSSAKKGGREMMLTLIGRSFADRLMVETKAETFGIPDYCKQCGYQLAIRRKQGRPKASEWEYRCVPCGGIRTKMSAGYG